MRLNKCLCLSALKSDVFGEGMCSPSLSPIQNSIEEGDTKLPQSQKMSPKSDFISIGRRGADLRSVRPSAFMSVTHSPMESIVSALMPLKAGNSELLAFMPGAGGVVDMPPACC